MAYMPSSEYDTLNNISPGPKAMLPYLFIKFVLGSPSNKMVYVKSLKFKVTSCFET